MYLITVCLAWIKGVSFEEGELFRFAMRRFSYVLEWAGIVVAVSTLIVRVPLVLASLHEYSRRPRLPADCAGADERFDHRVLFGPNLTGAP